jgi:ATP-dependent RNA helicase DDX27
MLSEGFADELDEIIKACSVSRQTMLFSATMTDSVDELVKMSLNKPVRLFVDPKHRTAKGLVQEFVRVRAEKEADRTALLVTLCKRSFKQGVIVFFRSKKLAHQIRIVFGLLGMKAEELHGDLTQEQASHLYSFQSVDKHAFSASKRSAYSVMDKLTSSWQQTWLLVDSISRASRL